MFRISITIVTNYYSIIVTTKTSIEKTILSWPLSSTELPTLQDYQFVMNVSFILGLNVAAIQFFFLRLPINVQRKSKIDFER